MEKLEDYALSADPIKSFNKWYLYAKLYEQNPEAMTLATVDKDGHPDARVLLFKGLQGEALTFYTNYLSHKASELERNPYASMVFYWHVTKRQVRLRGHVQKMTREESDRYFQSRDRESQLASYISEQSAPVRDKAELLKKLEEARVQFEGKAIPTPEHWGGYLLHPEEIEFFVYGDHRINDRFYFHLEATSGTKSWRCTRLQP